MTEIDTEAAEDSIVAGLAARFDRSTLSRLLDDARDLEHGKGRDAKAWEAMADLLWNAYLIRKD
jgi:hypothetical protein